MGRTRNDSMAEQLAVNLASGGTVRGFCKRHHVGESTARRWRALPGFAARVKVHQAELATATIARLSERLAARIDASLAATPG